MSKATHAATKSETQDVVPAADVLEVPMRGAAGEDLGFAIRLGATGETIADRIEGWSTLQVDGQLYTYSKARAAALLARFPYMVGQLEAPAGEKDEGK